MPYVFGKIYPETNSSGLLNHKFKLLIDPGRREAEIYSFLIDLATLRVYLHDITDCPAQVQGFVFKDINSEKYKALDVKILEVDRDSSNFTEEILLLCDSLGIDLFVSEDKDLIKLLSDRGGLNFAITGYERAKREVEVFVRGHEIPWAFSDPVWGMPWTVFYSMNEELGKKAYSMYEVRFKRAGLDSETTETLRSLLLNRLANICYTRDKLLFYVQQGRFARRMKWKQQAFQFEASYYLCHYYLLLWGAVDQLSRILNGALKLGVTRFIEINIKRDDFIRKIAVVDANLANLFKEEKNVEWLTQLKRNRDFTAHQGSIVLSPLLEKPKSEPTEDELEREAEATPTWSLMKRSLPSNVFEGYRRLLKEQLRISRYKVLIEDAMIIEDKNQQYVFRPLGNIEWDFNNFETITLQALELLHELLLKIKTTQ